MNGFARLAVVTALGDLATSGDFRDRADAGQALAAFADMPGARSVLRDLLLDTADTAVTQVTAEALLRRHDDTGLALVAAAMAGAAPSTLDHLGDAVGTVFAVHAGERDAALDRCAALHDDPDDAVRRGAAELSGILAELTPVLRPVPPDAFGTA